MDPGYVYAVVKEDNWRGRWVINELEGIPKVKLGFSKEPDVRHEEPVRESSTWHPERFRCVYLKRVPSMREAEKKLHTFFEEDNITPAYPKGGVEWFAVSLDRVKLVFDALPSYDKKPYQHSVPPISMDVFQQFLGTTTIEAYESVRPEGFPTIHEIRDGYFGDEYTDIAMLMPVTRR